MKDETLEQDAEAGSERSMNVWTRENKKDLEFYLKLDSIWKQKIY